MSLRSRRELEVTRAKLRLLEEKYAELKGQPAADAVWGTLVVVP